MRDRSLRRVVCMSTEGVGGAKGNLPKQLTLASCIHTEQTGWSVLKMEGQPSSSAY